MKENTQPNKRSTRQIINRKTVLLLVALFTFLMSLSIGAIAQTIDRAALQAKAEEGIKYLTRLLEEATAKAEATRPKIPPKPYDPEQAKAAEAARWLAIKQRLAPRLFVDGKPTAEGEAFLNNKVARERAIAAAGKTPGVFPKVDIRQRTAPKRLSAKLTSSLENNGANGPEASGGNEPRLELITVSYDPTENATLFELWLIDAPLDEFWNIFRAPVLQPSAWVPAFIGPPVAVFENIQQFFVAVSGQPSESYFQIFLHQDSDFDGLLDGYEVTLFKTDPENPDSSSTRDANGDGVPDYPGLAGNGIADGDEDFDGDGQSTFYELQLGVHPLVAQDNQADADSDGLPDWVEALTTFWTGDPAPAPQGDSDGDGVNNFTEWSIRTDPSWPFDAAFADFSSLPDAQRVFSPFHIQFTFNSQLRHRARLV